MFKQRAFLFTLLCLFTLPIVAQDSTSIAYVSRKAITNMAAQIKGFPQEKIYLHSDKPYYAVGERIWFRAHMVHSAIHIPYNLSRYVYVELINAENKVEARKKLYPLGGMYFGQMDLTPDLPEGWYSLRAYTSFLRNVGDPYFFRRPVYIGNNLREQKKASTSNRRNTGDYQVTFHPEGGHLLSDVTSRIALRAVTDDGLETNVSGRVVDETNKEVAIIKPTVNGLGLVSFVPQKGKRYTALCENKEGKAQAIALPAVTASGFVLSAGQSDTAIHVTLNHTASTPVTDTLMLMVHQRGVPVYHTFITPDQQSLTVPKEGFSDGILQLVLYNRLADVLSERQLFILGRDHVTVEVSTDKPNYRRREKVTATIRLVDAKGQAIPGDFSLSVTDDADVTHEEADETIKSRLLLQSDFNQAISKPGQYLAKNDEQTRQALDLLMLALPWERYKVANVLKGKPAQGNTYALERGSAISGRVLRFPSKRPLPGTNVSLFIQRLMFIDAKPTDKDGRFYFDGFELPDSTKALLQADKGMGNFTDIVVDPDSFPAVNANLPLPETVIVEEAMNRFMKKSREKYAQENGLITINLAEVEVVARKQEQEKMMQLRLDRGAVYFSPSRTFTANQIEQAATLVDLLITVAGVTLDASGTGVLIRNATPIVMVDGIKWTMEDLNHILPSEVEMMDVLKDPADLASLGSEGANGAICIYLKRGEAARRKEELGNHQAMIMPLGYCVPEVFPQPDYLKPEVRMNGIPDLRSTIYWNPAVVCNEEGVASVSFFMADNPGTYTLILEGVTPKGQPFRYQGKITVRP